MAIHTGSSLTLHDLALERAQCCFFPKANGHCQWRWRIHAQPQGYGRPRPREAPCAMPMASSRNPPTASPENGHPSLMCLPRVMVHQLSSPAGSWLKDNGMHILKLDLAMLFNSHSQKSRKTEIVIRATSRR